MSDDVLERVRMCVAEAGYDPQFIVPPPHEWGSFGVVLNAIPHEVTWRAREISAVAKPICKACSRLASDLQVPTAEGCRAVRRLELDCGVSRV
jgi:hypothetical protein